MKLLVQLLGLACLMLPILAVEELVIDKPVVGKLAVNKPKVPLSSTSRWIVDPDGKRVKLRCINWAGHLETNIPEGLHKQPVYYIAGWIAAQGFNCVRLTYSIDMALNPTVKVKDSFRNAAAATGVSTENFMKLYTKAVGINPFLAHATVLDVFDAVQAALWDQGVMTILDNHVSKASWCCNLEDGNGWWKDAPGYMFSNSRYFDTQKWLDGLAVMAKWSYDNRPGIVGLSLRNELRASYLQLLRSGETWLAYMKRAGSLVHLHNPDALVIVGGINGGTDLTPLRGFWGMNTSPWLGKNVWEVHQYSFTVTTPSFGSCAVKKAEYGALFGFVLQQGKDWTAPLFLAEFGVGMTGGPRGGLTKQDYDFLTCLVGYMEGNDADWALWAVQGSYYVRGSTIDYNETWGALGYSWTDWRKPNFIQLLGKMVNVTQGPGEREATSF